MAESFISRALTADGQIPSPAWSMSLLGGAIAALFLINILLTPRLNPDEPQLLKPSIPLIGHIIGILSHQNDYHRIVNKEHPVPIASLQMLWGKIYTVWDPRLAQNTLRSDGASFDPFIVEFAQAAFGLSKETFAKIRDSSGMVPAFVAAIHASMKATYVHEMNVNALNYISQTLDAVQPGDDGGINVPNLYLWLRDIISLATTRALLGKENPFEKDASLIDTLWDFETDLPYFFTRPFPSITIRKGYAARNRIQSVLGDYYEAEHDLNDPTVAHLTRGRANALRKFGFTNREVAKVEIMLPVVGTTNSAPAMYWMMCYVFARPELVERLRQEVLPLVRKDPSDPDTVTVDISKLETECPLLVSCYRETLRLVNYSVSMRRTVKDTTVSDGNGRSYLLKAGVDVQIPAGIAHRSEDVWGTNADDFDPERFLPGDKKTDDKAKRNAYFPFGGGRHLCPGRYFAFAEILAITCALAVGFDLVPTGMGMSDMKPQPAKLATAIVKPVRDGEGLGIKLTRRKGWEKTKWRFES